ncbi:MAG: hypothetical protein ACK4GT_20440 [Pararhodobacter sp.]
MAARFPSLLARLTAALAVLALLVGISAHHSHRPQEASGNLALAALGLTGADLCAGTGSDDAAAQPDCPACVLAKALALPPSMPAAATVCTWAPADPAPRAEAPRGRHVPRAPPARGPPTALV